MQMVDRYAHDDAIERYLREWSQENEGAGDAFIIDNEELIGLTILDKPHIDNHGSICAFRLED